MNNPVVDKRLRVPLSFAKNTGQLRPETRFESRGNGYAIELGIRAIALRLPGNTSPVQISWQASAGQLEPEALEPLPGKMNYLLGADPAKWHTGIPTFARVRYGSVAPGVDLVFYGNQRQLEYDIVFKPGADATAFTLQFAGVDNLEVDPDGDLLLHTGAGTIKHKKPVTYQQTGATCHMINARYRLLGASRVGFEVASYDRTQALVIDPVMSYATMFGGTSNDRANAIAADTTGAAYIVGMTQSTDFPIVGSSSAGPRGSWDAFLLKFDPAGTAIEYSTVFGGTGMDEADSIVVDGSGNAYVSGNTWSTNFPVTAGAAQATAHGRDDGFLTAFNATGSGMLFSTYLGGSDNDAITGLALDPTGNVYVAGTTGSVDFPTTPGAYISTYPGSGGSGYAFVSKLSNAGQLVWSTLLGGSLSNATAAAITVDSSGSAYVTGEAVGSTFPTTTGAYQASASGVTGAYATKFTPDGSAVVFSTMLQGNTAGNYQVVSAGAGIGQDSSGVYVAGTSNDNGFPCLRPGHTPNEIYSDIFLLKLNPAGTAVLSCHAFGGSGDEEVSSLVIDSNQNAFLAGNTGSVDFPVTANAPFATFLNSYLMKVSADGTLVYSTYVPTVLGGMTVQSPATVYIAGTGGIVTNDAYKDYGSFDEAYFAKFVDSSCTFSLDTSSYNSVAAATLTVNVTTQPGCIWFVGPSSSSGVRAYIPLGADLGADNGNGSGAATVDIGENLGLAKTATLSIAGQIFTITQAYNCQFTVSQPNQVAGMNGSTMFIDVATSDPACSWSATSNNSWLTANSGVQTGPGGFAIVASALSGPRRTGTVQIANQTVTVQQEAQGDFNGDGYTDVLWQDPNTGTTQVWTLGGAQGVTLMGAVGLTGANAWRIAAVADINGDGHPDVIWQDPNTGQSQVWFLGGSTGTSVIGSALLSGPNPWRIVAVADVYGDGGRDLIWQDPQSGAAVLWRLGGSDGTALVASLTLSGPNSWRIAAVADIDGNNYPDIIWQDPATGEAQAWLMSSTDVLNVVGLSGPNPWRIAGAADFNHDGHADLIWRDPGSGATQVWFMGGGSNGQILTGFASLSGANSWTVAGLR